MYSVRDYGQMIADEARMDAYARALARVVRPDSIVLDIGTGTGIFALLACRFGAKRVYAVEPGEAIDVARRIAEANGFADRIDFLKGGVEEIELPQQASVIVSDLRGALPYHGRHLRAIGDARERLLRPGGCLIPLRDELWGAPLESDELYQRHCAIWTENRWGIDMRAARELVVNGVWSAARERQDLLGDPAHLATLDYSAPLETSVRTECSWAIARPGTLHGILLWFDATLAEGIGFSTAPGARTRVYGQVCLPLAEAVPVREGDAVELSLRADQVAERYIWTWDTRVCGASTRARFRQSSFFGDPLAADRLRAFAPDHAPGLSDLGWVDRCVLDLMGRGMENEKIARRVAEAFPARYPTWRDALDRVGALSALYGAGAAGEPRISA